MTQAQITQAVDDIFVLYEQFGADDYIGEPVSQIEHMAQSAQLAERAGYGPEVILAAFFHDLGHLCARTQPHERMAHFGVKRHEQIGADYLRQRGFGETVAQLVENHVQAKRYLTLRQPAYYEALSEASKNTLEFQGGRMTEAEAVTFEQNPLFELSIKMRTWDEQAKETNVPVPDLAGYKQLATNYLAGR
jgi:2-amino-1-hydroxyethylphosphonate dioxygenase (glycine-forming)